MQQCAFIQTGDDEYLVILGPLTYHDTRPENKDAIYAPDFWSTKSRGWITGQSLRLRREEWRSFVSHFTRSTPSVKWNEPSERYFRLAWDGLQELFSHTDTVKGVPYSFMTGRIGDAAATFQHVVSTVPDISHSVHSYGLIDHGRGFFGATPEVLFKLEGSTLSTMALAGTRKVSESAEIELLTSQKEKHEHGIVVSFLQERLGAFTGSVVQHPRRVVQHGTLMHLRTDFEVKLNDGVSFDRAVELLHPTPALGYAPSNAQAAEWLNQLSATLPRGRFGAPVGYALRDSTDSECFVAIRGFQFGGPYISVWAGCGVVKDSIYESEWEEVKHKINAVRMTWAL